MKHLSRRLWRLGSPNLVVGRFSRIPKPRARWRVPVVPLVGAVGVMLLLGSSFSPAARADGGLTLSVQAPAGANPLGADVVVTAAAVDGTGSPVPGVRIGWGGGQLSTYFCIMDSAGSCTTTVTPPWTHGGRVGVYAWVDLNQNFSFDAGEPFDQGLVVWEPQVASVSVTPSETTSPVRINDVPSGAPVVFTAQALDTVGSPVYGASINIRVSGAVDTSEGPCGWTDAAGECSTDVPPDRFPGTRTLVTGCFDANANGSMDAAENICGTGSVSWIAPASTKGSIVGKGTFGSSPRGGPTQNIAFAVSASNDGTATLGSCLLVDAALGHTLQCLNASTFVIAGTHVLVLGTAKLDGASTAYRIDVDRDFDLKGQRFHVSTSAGWGFGGSVLTGKLFVHT
jgi:hypothetical protein